MYVDDSGTPHLSDESKYYVISGVILNVADLFSIECLVEDLRGKFFIGRYKDEEIHMHEIYKSQGNFVNLTKGEKYKLVNAIYQMIDALPIMIITVCIHKQKLSEEYPSWSIFNAAWTFLVERFDTFTSERGDRGTIVIDRSTNMDEIEITEIIQGLILKGSNVKPIRNINLNVHFYDSRTQHGLQVADASSYCTLRTLDLNSKFKPYWLIVKGKLRKSTNGRIFGYGFKVFPSSLEGEILKVI